MTIREMETVTGLTRANIRFYENQGLIAPERKENNYREYSQQDGEVLLRIRLLRALGMTIEQIRALQTGRENLIAALDRQIEVLTRQQEALGHSQRVCREMRQDNVSYATLDARRYLSSLENPPKAETVITRDVEPKLFAPWQRYWARSLDGFLYNCILITAATWIGKGALPQWGSVWSILFGIGMTMVLEPVQLRLFGTTFGKWIFGIRVTDPDGRNLTLSDGIYRTWDVIFRGQGLHVPFVGLWREWKGYVSYRDGEALPWEYDSEVTVKDKKPLRYIAAIAAAALVFAVSVGLMLQAQLPEHRGALTKAEFCENYRKLAQQQDIDFGHYTLEDDGIWTHQPELEMDGVVYIDLSGNEGPLDISFLLTSEGDSVSVEGQRHAKVEGLVISEAIEGSVEGFISSRTNQRRLLALTMLMAQPDYSIYAGAEEEILTAISEHPFESFRVSVCGLRFLYDVEYTGYWETGLGTLIEDDDPETESYYYMIFTILKEE